MPVFNNDYGTFLGSMMERMPERMMNAQTTGAQFQWMGQVANKAKKFMDSDDENERMLGMSWLSALIDRQMPSFIERTQEGVNMVGAGSTPPWREPLGNAVYTGDGSNGNQWSSRNYGGKYGPKKIVK